MRSGQFKTIALSLICGCLGAALWNFASKLTVEAAQAEKVVEVTELRLVDRTGQLRARLHTVENETHFDFFQDKSTIRFYESERLLAEVGLSPGPDSGHLISGVLLYNPEGLESGWASFLMRPDGFPGLFLRRNSGSNRSDVTLQIQGPLDERLSKVLRDTGVDVPREGARLYLEEFALPGPSGGGSMHSVELEAADPTFLLRKGGADGEGAIRVDASEPSIGISDSSFRTVIGRAHLTTPETGEKTTTSPASILMFGEDGKLIWKRP